MEVRPGDRVTVHGLTGRPELNGQSGILVGPAANGRITVRLDSGEQVALKQANLGIAAPNGGGAAGAGGGGSPGFGGGMPGGFRMPGGFGMPGGGMPSFGGIAAAATKAVERLLLQLGVALPPGITPGQAAAAAAAASLAALWLVGRVVPMRALLLVAVLAYAGLKTERGRLYLARGAARASAATGRPLAPGHLLLAICIVVALMGRGLLGGSSQGAGATVGAGGSAPEHSSDFDFGRALREAYQQGYDDGVAGLAARPPMHIVASSPTYDRPPPPPPSGGGGSGLGFGSMMRYAMVASYLFKAGQVPGGSWSPQALMANIQANPMQAGMMLLMVSGVLF